MGEIEDRLAYPRNLNDMLDTMKEYFLDNPGTVLSFHIEVGEPMVGKRQYIPGSEATQETPYSILRSRTIVNIQKPADTSLGTLFNMNKQVMSAGYVPTCLIAWSPDVYEWISMEEGRNYLFDIPKQRQRVLGAEVHIDRELTEGTIILAGASNPYGGIWGLEYGVRHSICADLETS